MSQHIRFWNLSNTVNSDIFARVLFSWNFDAKFRENKILAKWLFTKIKLWKFLNLQFVASEDSNEPGRPLDKCVIENWFSYFLNQT